MIVFHLLNDFSGSPRVLKNVLEEQLRAGRHITLYTSAGGVLDELAQYPTLTTCHLPYRFGGILTPFRYLLSQLRMYRLALRHRDDDTFYINTLLPVGAALAGHRMQKHVIYHYHEDAPSHGLHYRILARAMEKLATEIICVSDYQRSRLHRSEGVHTIPNRLSPDFTARLHPNPEAAFERKRVLMIASPRRYKRIDKFVELAQRLPEFSFELLINENEKDLNLSADTFTMLDSHYTIPGNMTVYSAQSDVAPFYNRASLLLCLSDCRMVVETFGMTVLEAQTAGLPVIVPTVGGVAERVQDGVNGYKIDVENLNAIEKHIQTLLSDRALYLQLAAGALNLTHNHEKENRNHWHTRSTCSIRRS